MLLKVSENRYINRLEIREAKIEDEYVWFMDKNGRTLAAMRFNSEKEVKDFVISYRWILVQMQSEW